MEWFPGLASLAVLAIIYMALEYACNLIMAFAILTCNCLELYLSELWSHILL